MYTPVLAWQGRFDSKVFHPGTGVVEVEGGEVRRTVDLPSSVVMYRVSYVVSCCNDKPETDLDLNRVELLLLLLLDMCCFIECNKGVEVLEVLEVLEVSALLLLLLLPLLPLLGGWPAIRTRSLDRMVDTH